MTQVTNPFEGKFPSFPLTIWPLVPLGIAAFVYLAEVIGHGVTNHASVYFYIFFIIASATVAFIFSLFVLPKAISRLNSNPTDKTTANYIAVTFSIAFDLAFLVCAFLFFQYA